ncbi:T9SS type A sorting domain-containing protein [Hymenobacter algoricola]|uniref:T9SS type A sorting domain-containing protein n=1 Tax=Hymenobacter algoricola TaxID=486267 RepID=A0ABP7N7G6_9BACT
MAGLRIALCAGFLLPGAPSWAQTAPGWTLARRLTSGGIDPTRDGGSADGIRVDAGGNMYVVGDFHGTLDVGGTVLSSPDGYDSYLAKYSPSGTLLWAKHLNGANYETVAPAVALDAGGNAYLTGSFYGSVSVGGITLTDPTYTPGGTQLNGYVAKFSPTGALLWAQRLGAATGSSGSAGGSGIAVDAAGNVVLGGWFSGSVTIGTTTLTSTLYVDANGSYPSQDILLAKLDPQGTVLWARHDGGQGGEGPSDLSVDASNNIYVGGSYGGDATFGTIILPGTLYKTEGFVAKYSAAGTPQWATGMPPAIAGLRENIVRHLSADPAGNVSLIGNGEERPPAGPSNFRSFVARYTPQGALAWSFLSSPSEDSYNVGIVTDAAGNSYLDQAFMGSITLAGVTLTGSAPTAVNLCVIALTPQGTLRWSLRNDSGEMGGSGIGLDPSGQVYIAGVAVGPVQLGSFLLAANSATYEPFIARLTSGITAAKPGQVLPALAVYPNPTDATTTVSLPSQPHVGYVVMRDLAGRLVQQVAFAAAATKVPLPLAGVAAGLYTVQVVTAAGFSPLARLVVQ